MRVFILILVSGFLNAQVNSFSLNVNGTPPVGFTTALNIAAEKWSQYLQVSVPVKVNVFTVNSGLLPFSAITVANGRKDFTNAPVTNTLYTTALANQLAGTETNPGEFDMDIYFNLASSYYFGTGKPAANQKDFISTAMHEIGHGLGFYSTGYVNNSGSGSFGNVPSSVLFPLVPSFPWHGQDGVPCIYDKFIKKQSGSNLVGLAAQNSNALGDSIKNNPHYFSGPLYANPSHSNTPIRLSGGAGTYTRGVDLLHIHDSYANTIMSYYWGNGDTVRIPGAWELGLLREIGWNLKPIGIKEESVNNIHSFYPVPTDEVLRISGNEIDAVEIYDAEGIPQCVLKNDQINEEFKIDTRDLLEGIYYVRVAFKSGTMPYSRKVIIMHKE